MIINYPILDTAYIYGQRQVKFPEIKYPDIKLIPSKSIQLDYPDIKDFSLYNKKGELTNEFSIGRSFDTYV